MMRAWWRLGLYAVVLYAVMWMSACTKSEVVDAAEVIAVIDADDDLKPQLSTIQVDVLDKDAVAVASSHEFVLEGSVALPLSFGIYQPENGADVFRLHTRGYDARGELLVEDKVIDRFEKGQRRDLKVTLSSACRLNFCAANTTCDPRDGTCRQVPRPEGVGEPRDTLDGAILGDDGGDAGSDGSDAAASADVGAASTDAGPASTDTAPVPPSLVGFVSAGGRVGDRTAAVYDFGFEEAARVCTADRQSCATVGFSW